MKGVSIQERYDEICQLSGLSEEIIRRVFKATRESLVKSLLQGERATLPGVVTLTPEIRTKVGLGGDNLIPYIKIKASASTALETEVAKQQGFNGTDDVERKIAQEQAGMQLLNFVNSQQDSSEPGVLTHQIGALL